MSKSLHRMLTPKRNPTTENFFAMLRVLQQKTGVKVEVNAIHAAGWRPTVKSVLVRVGRAEGDLSR